MDGLGRFLQGENVFPVEGASQPEAQAQPSDTQPKQLPYVDEHGNKIIPHITLDRINVRRDGDTMTVTGWVFNHSEHIVKVDYISVLGQKKVIQDELKPNEGDQWILYKGSVAADEYHSHAELIFRRKLPKEDLFKNVYHVEFNRESDGKFVIEEFHEDGPVRDI